jgi:hypothetical protein
MSREQAEISGLDVDTRSDVHSLCVLLCELLTRTTPLNRETLGRAGFAELLRRIREDDDPVEAGPPSAWYRLCKLARTHRAVLATAGAFALMLVAATLISAALAVAGTRARHAAQVAEAQTRHALEETKRANTQAEAVSKYLVLRRVHCFSRDSDVPGRWVEVPCSEISRGRCPHSNRSGEEVPCVASASMDSPTPIGSPSNTERTVTSSGTQSTAGMERQISHGCSSIKTDSI